MMRTFRWIFGHLAVLTLLVSQSSAAINLTVTDGYLRSYADDGSGSSSANPISPVSGSTSLIATDGSAYSRLDYTYTNPVIGNQASFRLDYVNQTLGDGDHLTEGYGYVDFTLAESVTYVLTGRFEGSTTDLTYASFENYLQRLSGGSSVLAREYEYKSDFSGSFQFVVDGIQQGTVFTSYNLSGTIGPGTYRYLAFANLDDHRHSLNESALARGFSQLALTSSGSVPEPGTLTMFGLGGLIAGGFRRRFRNGNYKGYNGSGLII